jgi:hypothetical protein
MKDQSLSVRYPVGMFEYGKEYSNLDTLRHIREIADLPKKLKKIVKKLREGALDKTYRQHGWTVRQVIHHLADSHMNAYVRMKLAVTENAPIVKPYEEQLWAETEDGKHGSVGISLKLLSALHKRWVFFLSHLSDEELDRVYYNPSGKRTIQVREAIALYTWHGKHHLAHVKLVAAGGGKHEAGEAEVVEVKAKRAPGTGSAGNVTGKVVGETEAPKRRGRPALAKPVAKPASQSRKKGTKVVSDTVQNIIRTTAEEIAADKAAATSAPKGSATEKVVKTRAAKPADTASSADKPRRGRPPVNKAVSETPAEVQPVVVSETSSEKPRRGRPAVNKAPATEKVVKTRVAKPADTAVSSEKPKRGRPAVNKAPATEKVAKTRVAKPVDTADSSDKPKRGRPAVNKAPATEKVAKTRAAKPADTAVSSEKPKRGRRTPEEIAAEKEKKG